MRRATQHVHVRRDAAVVRAIAHPPAKAGEQLVDVHVDAAHHEACVIRVDIDVILHATAATNARRSLRYVQVQSRPWAAMSATPRLSPASSAVPVANTRRMSTVGTARLHEHDVHAIGELACRDHRCRRGLERRFAMRLGKIGDTASLPHVMNGGQRHLVVRRFPGRLQRDDARVREVEVLRLRGPSPRRTSATRTPSNSSPTATFGSRPSSTYVASWMSRVSTLRAMSTSRRSRIAGHDRTRARRALRCATSRRHSATISIARSIALCTLSARAWRRRPR